LFFGFLGLRKLDYFLMGKIREINGVKKSMGSDSIDRQNTSLTPTLSRQRAREQS
jgi:hypothetical protein